MTIERIIGDNVREFRKRLKLSQEDLAEHAELHRTYIGTIERAEQSITVGSLEKLAKALKMEAHLLLIKDAYKKGR